MKKLLFVIFVVLIPAIGCLPTAPPSNEPPTAYIDLVSPTSAAPGETVTFIGHGIDPDGSIAAYNWLSSLDGDLSTSASFKASSLSQGTHTIWFKVQDDKGTWSKQVLATVFIIPSGAVKPVINSFEASPGIINPGESSTLSWNVSGAATVSIDPEIGNVALSGTRVVLPTKATTYTLAATNEFGSVTVTAQIVVTTVPVHTVELFSIGAEDGHVRRDRYIGQEVMVGYTVEKVGIQGFLSFDISALPKDATITSVSLDLDPAATYVYGSPFERMGQLYICKNQYDKLDSNDYFVGPVSDFRTYGPTTPVICSLIRWPSSCSSSSLMVAAVQEQVDAGSARFQVRLQFEKDPYWEPYGTRWSEQWAAREANYLNFGQAKPKLVIQYQD
jgi:hypothetical protein